MPPAVDDVDCRLVACRHLAAWRRVFPSPHMMMIEYTSAQAGSCKEFERGVQQVNGVKISVGMGMPLYHYLAMIGG